MSNHKVSPVDAVRAARDWAECLPLRLRPTWIVLATYYPNIFPELETIASLTGVSRATAARRVAELEKLGAISTAYTYTHKTGVTKQQAHRTLYMPELGTSPANEQPDWALAVLVSEPRRKSQVVRPTDCIGKSAS